MHCSNARSWFGRCAIIIQDMTNEPDMKGRYPAPVCTISANFMGIP